MRVRLNGYLEPSSHVVCHVGAGIFLRHELLGPSGLHHESAQGRAAWWDSGHGKCLCLGIHTAAKSDETRDDGRSAIRLLHYEHPTFCSGSNLSARARLLHGICSWFSRAPTDMTKHTGSVLI